MHETSWLFPGDGHWEVCPKRRSDVMSCSGHHQPRTISRQTGTAIIPPITLLSPMIQGVQIPYSTKTYLSVDLCRFLITNSLFEPLEKRRFLLFDVWYGISLRHLEKTPASVPKILAAHSAFVGHSAIFCHTYQHCCFVLRVIKNWSHVLKIYISDNRDLMGFLKRCSKVLFIEK